MSAVVIVAGICVACGGSPAAQPPAPANGPPPPASQNPSPMVEQTRAHGRLQPRDVQWPRFAIDSLLPKSVDVFVRPGADTATQPTLVIHFLGAAFIPIQAVADLSSPAVLAVVNLTAGGGAYEQPFLDTTTFARLLAAIERRAIQSRRFGRVYLSGFSAGYGAIRGILRHPPNAARVDGVLLLDGLHTSYIPERRVVADGGVIDSLRLEPYVRFARLAIEGKKRFVITHSEIFPGTFASTTETTDYLLRALGMRRSPVLAWGPHGMQQLSNAEQGGFRVMGFAGNTGPDHIDHLHALPVMLALVVR